MTTNPPRNREAIRYSEAFKVSVVHELETSGLAFNALARKYGIKGTETVQKWVRKYGNGSRGKVIRVEKPEEIDQTKKLKERVRVLERTVGSLHVELALERAYTDIACERAGIADVAAELLCAAAGAAGAGGGCGADHRTGASRTAGAAAVGNPQTAGGAQR